MKRRHFIKRLGFAASLPWLGQAAIAANAPSSRANAGSFKILTCNVRVPQPQDEKSGDGWEARKDLCAEVIAAQHADIICLQEARDFQLTDLKSKLAGLESFALANPDAVFHPANAILFSKSRYEMVSAGGFWLSETPHVAGSSSWDSARPRFANWVHLKERGSGREFRVWNSHFDHIGQVAREKQAQLINQASDALAKDFPQVFTADCNAEATNEAIKKLKAGGWTETYAAVHGPEDPGFTFHGFRGPKYGDKNPSKLKGKIDWIFCRGGVKTLSAEIIRDGRNGRYPSDHYFLSAELALSNDA